MSGEYPTVGSGDTSENLEAPGASAKSESDRARSPRVLAVVNYLAE